ncbi:hypothetical protein ACP26L_22965 [Paenibacillus sp. S-38]|uniref:hypothetical protein n=1 Tax=Paenibacillus sp. S-38 TaxID=3416710 RepID=UPI003CF90A59
MEKVIEKEEERIVRAEDIVRFLEIDPEAYMRWCRHHRGGPSEDHEAVVHIPLVS